MAIKYKWLALRLEELIPSYIKKESISFLPSRLYAINTWSAARLSARPFPF